MFLKSELFEEHDIEHGFGLKGADVMGILRSAQDDALNRRHPDPERAKRVEGEGSPERRMMIPTTNQLHGTDIICLDDIDTKKLYEADAFYTTKPDILCFVRTADCLPLLISDTKRKAVAAVHAGWRGACGRIASKAIKTFHELGSQKEDIICAIGPHICKECFEVGTDVLEKFKENSWPVEKFFEKFATKYKLNLAAAVTHDLTEAGIAHDQIDNIDICTYCTPEKLHSYRREGGDVRQYNFIHL